MESAGCDGLRRSIPEKSCLSPKVRDGGEEELPPVRGQGRWQRVPGYNGAGASERIYPISAVRSGSQEELPHI